MKSFNEKSRESYNKKADEYDNTLDGRFTLQFKQLLLDEIIIKQESNVLDVACGNGTLLKMISEKCIISGYGVDISENMIANAKIRNPSMQFEVADCESIPYSDEQFDIITVCAAYHHFPNVKSFARETRRLLKPNSKLYIAEVYYPAPIRTICSPLFRFSKEGDVKIYSPKEIINNFEASGFRLDKFKRSGHIQIIVLQRL